MSVEITQQHSPEASKSCGQEEINSFRKAWIEEAVLLKIPHWDLGLGVCNALLKQLNESFLDIENPLDLMAEGFFSKKHPTIDDIIVNLEKIPEADLKMIDTQTRGTCEF
jgi:hypothetical protein